MLLTHLLFFIFLSYLINFIHSICPGGAIQGFNSNVCYKLFGTPTDFQSAQVKCQFPNNGNLTSIMSAFANGFIVDTLQEILLDSSTQISIGGYKNGSSWYWLDGNPFSYTNWAKGQPSTGNCLSINPSQTTSNWYSSNCSTSMPFLCEVPVISDSTPTVPPINIQPQCRQGYQYFRKWNSCYKFGSPPLNYNAAEQNCITEGGHLASIHSQEEEEFIDDLVHRTAQGLYYVIWIGFNNSGNKILSFIQSSLDVNDVNVDNWQWTDGTETTYNNWYPSEPTTIFSCADMITTGNPYINRSYWSNCCQNCSSAQYYVCKQNPICVSN